MKFSTVKLSVMYCRSVQSCTAQYSLVQCILAQYSAVKCSVLPCSWVHFPPFRNSIIPCLQDTVRIWASWSGETSCATLQVQSLHCVQSVQGVESVHSVKSVQNPILVTRISCSSVLRPPSSVRHARTTPPKIWNGLDWRALVKSRHPNIGKLRG